MNLRINFLFRKRIMKNKLIPSPKKRRSRVLSRKKFFKFRQNRFKVKPLKLKYRINKQVRTLLKVRTKKILKSRFNLKRRLRLFNKRKYIKVNRKYTLTNRPFFSKNAPFFFKWIKNQLTLSKPVVFNLNFFSIFSETNSLRSYHSKMDTTSNYVSNSFILFSSTLLLMHSSIFKNYLTILKKTLFNDRVFYKTNIFNLNRIGVIDELLLKSPKLTHVKFNKRPKKLISKKVKRFNKNTLNLFFKHLSYIEVLKMFRLNFRKKITFYNIPILNFFENNILRVDQKTPNYKFNIVKFKRFLNKPTFKGMVPILNYTRQDNLFLNKSNRRLKSKTIVQSLVSKITPNSKKVSAPSIVNLKKSTKSSSMFTNSVLISRNLDLFKNIYNKPLLVKYLMFDNYHSFWEFSKTSNKNLNLILLTDFNKYLFNSRDNIFLKTNLIPTTILRYTIRRKLLKIINFHKLSSNIIMWYYNILIRFIENCSGRKVFLKFNPFIENALTFSDLARCSLWHIRVTGFQRILGPKIFLHESLKILHIAIRFKDPTFLSNWIKGMLYRMSFWKYRLLFRYLKYLFRYLFWLHFPELDFKGFKLRLKGKISVAGNARTRTLLYRIGETSHSKVNNRVLSDFTTINSFTGVMGFKIWFFF